MSFLSFLVGDFVEVVSGKKYKLGEQFPITDIYIIEKNGYKRTYLYSTWGYKIQSTNVIKIGTYKQGILELNKGEKLNIEFL